MSHLVWFIVATLPWLVYVLLREPRPKWVDKPDSPGLWWHRWGMSGVDDTLIEVTSNPGVCRMMVENSGLRHVDDFSGKWQKVSGPYV